MVHLPYLQPFEDVNKRVSRLAANLSLVRHNLCPLSFIDVPGEEQIRFIEVVETEVMSLHEGNITRYRLSPSQFEKWYTTWS